MLLAAAVLAAGCGGDDSREIAYGVVRDDVPSRIMVVEDDGANPRRLAGARQGSSPVLPAWSPNGRRLAFVRFNPRGGAQSLQVYVVNADGTGERHLGEGTLPRWTRDGRSVVVERPRLPPQRSTLHVLSLDGGSRRLTDGSAPAVSSDGSRVAFLRHTYRRTAEGRCCERAGSTLLTVALDGSGLRRLARSGRSGYFAEPGWAPGGSAVSVIERRVGVEGPLYVISPAGTRRVIARGVGETYDWSPDGKMVAYTGEGELRVVRRDGTQVARFPSANAIDIEWAPEGDTVAYSMQEGAAGASPQVGLYTADVDDEEPERFVVAEGFAAYFDWRPDQP